MAEIKIPFAVGDLVWVPHARKQRWVECPQCAGKRKHKVILGNGEETTVKCGYCQRGWMDPSGVVHAGYAPREAVLVKITDVSVCNGDDIRYSVREAAELHGWTGCFKPEEMYLFEDIAMSHCRRLDREEIAREDERLIRNRWRGLDEKEWSRAYQVRQHNQAFKELNALRKRLGWKELADERK